MSGTLSGNPQVSAAQWQARMTGQPAAVTVNGQTLLVSPDGSVRQSTATAATSTPSLWNRLTAPNSGVNQGLNVGTPVPGATTQVQSPLNQANPNTTYVSPATPQPATAAPVVGATGTQGGPSVAPTYNMPLAPTVAQQASTYRAAHGLSDGSETDRLNAESLAAAQAGRTNLNRDLAAQYGQPMAAGVSGPRTDVVNALTMPTTTQGQPIMLAPTTATTQTAPTPSQQQMTPAQANALWQRIQGIQPQSTTPQVTSQQAQNLLSQGLY